jgi:phosphomannomutase
MSLIKSISGIRGTIGGKPGDSLSPVDVVKFTAAFGAMVQDRRSNKIDRSCKVVIGRDARISGPVIEPLVTSTLLLMGIDVIDAGLATTPTIEMGVKFTSADAGIIITASHNPANWNALKLLNENGEFLSGADGEEILRIAEEGSFSFARVDNIGKYEKADFLKDHIKSIVDLHLVDREAIRKANFSVVVDAVNSVGGIAVPELLRALGVTEIACLNCIPDGRFTHNPEPLPENLMEISGKVPELGADLGIVVDPDVDRLALVCEDGNLFGEEYTLVAAADYVLSHEKGSTVSNMSSSMALRDITIKHACEYFSSPVGEVNVVEMMKSKGAVIGGEGNGGVIYPGLHYGRDALLGIALVLSKLARDGKKMSELKDSYPVYHMVKKKVLLKSLDDADKIIQELAYHYADSDPDLRDGIKISMDGQWIQVRKSNTEPVLRIYSESDNIDRLEEINEAVIKKIQSLMQS